VAPRANWKGFLEIDDLSIPVALYTAASTSDRVAFHMINRATGNRLRREYVDGETEKPVLPEDQVKGYEVAKGDYIIVEADEAAAALPESDKTLSVSAVVDCDGVDEIYFDRPYFLAPSDKSSAENFRLLAEAMQQARVVAIAQAVLFRRVHTLVIRPYGGGMLATMLHFDWQVRSAKEAFESIPSMKIKGEMLQLAEHIIRTKQGEFDPSKFEDRYEQAVADLVKAKLDGKKITPPKRPKVAKMSDLMEALRQSAQPESAEPPARRGAATRARVTASGKTARPRKKAS